MIKISPMTEFHAKQVYEIGIECFSMPWSLEGIKAELANPHAVTFVALKDDLILGFINAHCMFDEGYLNNIAVKQEYRLHGVGLLLVNQLIAYGKEKNISFFTLEVRRTNETAIRFYQHLGFEKIGERKNIYENPVEDALLYTKHIG